MIKYFAYAAFALFSFPTFAQEETPASPIAQAQLLLHAPMVVKDAPMRAGVLLTLPEGWHVYWQNPGDSGLAPTLDWTLPEGVTASTIHWPAPEPIESSGIVNYGYSGKVVLPVTLTANADAIAGDVSVKADWLVCKDICIPESATLTGTLPALSPQADVLLANVASTLPKRLNGTARYAATAETVTLTLTRETAWGDIKVIDLFPVDDGIVTNASTHNAVSEISDDGRSMTLQFPRAGSALLPVWHSVLALSDGTHMTIAAEQEMTPAPAPAPQTSGLPWLLVLAFAGGLLLNLMPCVLPILSLKALALAKKSGAEQRAARVQGIAFTLGVFAMFLAIAGAMLALKAGGASIGWGFQLQEPAVIAALFFLMLLVAFNLFGLFELPVLLGNQHADSHSIKGAFFTGVLAVALATPCSAPFMATAIGATLSLPVLQSLLVFAALGFGMAAPFLLISLAPKARAWLPKPGAWMQRFKHALAFPMFATGAWLLWVLVQINGAPGLALAMACGVLLAWLLWWAHGTHSLWRKHVLTLLAALVVAWGVASQPAPQTAPITRGEAFNAEKLSQLRAAGTPVFVDATAAWCITCKLNERVALADAGVEALFAEQGITLMVADWTTRDAAITAYLASFGRNGVPLYVYYPANGEPRVLPQLLTPASVRNALTQS